MLQNGNWFSFDVDEIVAYGAALTIAMEAAVLTKQLEVSALVFGAPVTRWRWDAHE